MFLGLKHGKDKTKLGKDKKRKLQELQEGRHTNAEKDDHNISGDRGRRGSGFRHHQKTEREMILIYILQISTKLRNLYNLIIYLYIYVNFKLNNAFEY